MPDQTDDVGQVLRAGQVGEAAAELEVDQVREGDGCDRLDLNLLLRRRLSERFIDQVHGHAVEYALPLFRSVHGPA